MNCLPNATGGSLTPEELFDMAFVDGKHSYRGCIIDASIHQNFVHSTELLVPASGNVSVSNEFSLCFSFPPVARVLLPVGQTNSNEHPYREPPKHDC